MAKKTRAAMDKVHAESTAKVAAHKGHIPLLEWALSHLSEEEVAAFLNETLPWAATAGGKDLSLRL